MKIIILFLVICCNLFAQNLEWMNYTSGDEIMALAEEGDYLWVGTFGGLVKLNKINSEGVFFNQLNSGLPDNLVRAITIDQDRIKWIGTWSGGLAKFDDVNWTLFNTSNSGLPDDQITSIVIDSIGNKWISTYGGGLVKYDGTNWTVYDTSNSEAGNYIWSLVFDELGNLWMDSNTGLKKFDGVNWTVYNRLNSGIPDDNVTFIAIDSSDKKWIGTLSGGLSVFDNTSWVVYDTSNSGIPDNWVIWITIDKNDNKFDKVFFCSLLKSI